MVGQWNCLEGANETAVLPGAVGGEAAGGQVPAPRFAALLPSWSPLDGTFPEKYSEAAPDTIAFSGRECGYECATASELGSVARRQAARVGDSVAAIRGCRS